MRDTGVEVLRFFLDPSKDMLWDRNSNPDILSREGSFLVNPCTGHDFGRGNKTCW